MIRELFLEDLSLWSCVWQSTLLIVIGLAGSFLLRHRPARAFQVLLLAMIAAVVVPAMSLLVKHFELGAFVAESIALQPETLDLYSAIPYEIPAVLAEPQTHVEAKEAAMGVALAEGSSGSIRIPWRTMLFFGWMVAVLALLGRLLVAFINGVHLIRRSRPKVCEYIQKALDRARTRLGITKNLQIRTSREISSPMIWCWNRTTVLLVPHDLDNNVDWAGVICHELAHCMRRDHISGLMAEMIACILCWNPLSWLAKKRLIRLGEQACDDWVVAGGRPVENYARSLLNFKPQKQAAFVPAVVHSRKGVARRVRRILKDSCVNPRTGATWALVVSLVTTCFAAGVAFAQTRPAEPEAASKAEAKRTESLHQAAAAGDIEQIKLLISNGADIDTADQRGQTPLHLAVRNGRKDVVVLLLTEGTNVEATDTSGRTPLHFAADFAIKFIELLTAKGANVSARDNLGNTPLHVAAAGRRGAKQDLLELLLAKGADVHVRNNKGETPLHLVARVARKCDVATGCLLATGAEVAARDDSGYTPLHMAAKYGRGRMAKLLLAKGAAIDEKTNDGMLALHLSAMNGHTAVVRLLLTEGAGVNAKTASGETPLQLGLLHNHKETIELLRSEGAEVSTIQLAAYVGDLGKVRRFIENGDNVNAQDSYGVTPLHAATSAGQRGTVEFLISKNAHVSAKNKIGETALHIAATGRARELVELLLANKADVDVRDEYECTPLHNAAVSGRKDVVALLMDNGADVRAKTKRGETPLLYAVSEGHKEVVELLVEKGADIKSEQCYMLHMACRRGRRALVQFLIQKGADVNTEYWPDNAPSLYAVWSDHTDVLELLLDHGADANAADRFGWSLLHYAAHDGHRDMTEMLLNKGADPKVRERQYGGTPLYWAAEEGHSATVELLISHGADANTQDYEGRTPLSMANGNGHTRVVELLRKHGAKE